MARKQFRGSPRLNAKTPRLRPPSSEDIWRAYYAGKVGDARYLRRIGRRASLEGEYGSIEKAWRRGVDAGLRPPTPPPRLLISYAGSSRLSKKRPGPRPAVTLEMYRAMTWSDGLKDPVRARLLTKRYGVPVNRQKARKLRLEDERTD